MSRSLRTMSMPMACVLLLSTVQCLPRKPPRSAGSRRSSGKGFGAARAAVLPAGTVVKHGTTSDVLQQILVQGLCQSGSVSAGLLRDKFETRPTTKGVYVAKSYAAYGTALVGFTSKMAVCVTTGFEWDPAKVPLPVVLNIRLQEECVLGPDEDYLKLDKELMKQFKKTATRGNAVERLWQKYGSGAIMRENGIPATWIESVECPHVPTATCLERACTNGILPSPQSLQPYGRWDRIPAVRDTFVEGDAQSLQELMDDAFKL
eukprot:4439408-Prymnesium_polylepis.1